jgi:glycosyltransferase involved in cell wall biosynthesis
MLFSVLIAHYNNFEYFKVCYESLKKQSYQNFEIILVDDCSTDNSFEKIKAFLKYEPRAKIYQNKENKGVGFTKRKCAELATGEIFAFLDPDDALVSDALEISSRALEEKNYIAAYSQLYFCDENLQQKELFKRTKKIPNKNSKFFNINFEIAHFFSFRRDIYLKTVGINQTLTSAVDQDLYLKLYEKGDFFFIEKPLYLYRIHEKGVSQDKSKKDKLNKNWHQVLREAIERRGITKLYGKRISEIDDLSYFLHQKQCNTILKKLDLVMRSILKTTSKFW